MDAISAISTRLFDQIAERWESLHVQRFIAGLLVAGFFASLLVIEVRRHTFLPAALSVRIPTNHFYAVEFAFSMLLFVEVVGLVFGLASSVSNAVGKQFEILSLILLRQTFKEFTYFEEPIRWPDVHASLVPMISDTVGALLIFVVLGFYYRAQRHQPITGDVSDQVNFVAAKKLIALGLMLTFGYILAYDSVRYIQNGRAFAVFEEFYTVLIFTDVLIVLISLRYSSTYHVVFRNSGFAIATVFIRLALIAPTPFNVLLGGGVVLFALGLVYAYNAFAPMPSHHGTPEPATVPTRAD